MDPSEAEAALQTLITSGWHLRAEDSMALVSLSIVLFDHVLTFGQEVEYIWKKKKSPISYLFLLNRYFGLIAFCVCMIALFSPNWTIERCRQFAKFEGVLTMVIVCVSECILILRVYAVHCQDKRVVALLGIIWIIQFCMMAFTLFHSGPVIIPPSPITYGCVLVADPKIGNLDIFFVVPSLVFDTVTIILLAIGIIPRLRSQSRLGMLKVLLRDGFMYFFIVFSVNIAWTVTGLLLQSDLKNVLSFFSTTMSLVLIGRLTLNVRVYHDHLPSHITFGSSGERLRQNTSHTEVQEGSFKSEIPLFDLKQPT